MKKFSESFNGSQRICDYYDCNNTQIVEYYNDKLYKLKLCNIHHLNPYQNISNIVPIFDKSYYSIFDDMGHNRCNYVGCLENKNLKYFHDGNWCESHGRIIFSLRHTALGKSDKATLLADKLREFTYRKIYNQKLVNDIITLENELLIDTDSSFNLKINIIHYEYCYDNYIYSLNKEKKISLFHKSNKEYFEELYKKKFIVNLYGK